MVEEQQNLNAATADLSGQVADIAGGDSAAAAGQTQVPTFDVEGEKVTLDQIKQWKSGHLMQADYTRKTQELAQQRAAIQPYQELADYLKTNPTQAQAIYGYLEGKPLPTSNEVDPVQMELQRVKQQTESLVGYLGKIEADKIIGEVKSDAKYGGLFTNPKIEETLLATHLQKGRGANLRETADELFAEITKREANLKLEWEKQLKDNLNSPTRKGTTGGSSYAPPKDFNPAKTNWNNLDKEALQML